MEATSGPWQLSRRHEDQCVTDAVGSHFSTFEVVDQVFNFYDAEAEVRLEQLTTLMEPLILLLMAGVVLTILLAIYLPIIQTISSGPFGGRK